MNRLLKAHEQFFNYVFTELQKKKTINTHTRFLLHQAKTYGKFLFGLYKGLFLVLDPEYQKQKAEFNKQQEIRKQITGMIKLLRYSKDKLRKAGLSRQRIRRFFIDLGSTDDEALQKLADDLMKEIGG